MRLSLSPKFQTLFFPGTAPFTQKVRRQHNTRRKRGADPPPPTCPNTYPTPTTLSSIFPFLLPKSHQSTLFFCILSCMCNSILTPTYSFSILFSDYSLVLFCLLYCPLLLVVGSWTWSCGPHRWMLTTSLRSSSGAWILPGMESILLPLLLGCHVFFFLWVFSCWL